MARSDQALHDERRSLRESIREARERAERHRELAEALETRVARDEHLLVGIAAHGSELRYHGDFDWKGVRIAALVARRPGTRPWRYDVSSYRAALAAHPGRVQRLRGEAPAPGADADLIATMRRCAGSLQEEAVLDELIEDLAARRSCGLTARGG